MRITYIGGPTALIEFGGCRFLTDPTFDAAGTDYPTSAYTLHKTQDPALTLAAVRPVDVVLLSHDHHFDNLDNSGRAFLTTAASTFTTTAGAERLAGSATGLNPWQSAVVEAPGGRHIRLTATPARHGPDGGDRGPVVGFILEAENSNEPTVYISGDTVWFDGVVEVGRRVQVDVAVLNLGAARVAVAGPAPLTFTADEAVTLSRAWPQAVIVPLHFEGWAHFSEGQAEIAKAFDLAGLTSRLRWLSAGRSIALP